MISNINQIKSPESKKKKSESLFNNVKEAVNNVLNPNTWKRIRDITAATLAALLSLSSCHDDLDTTPPRIDIIQKNIEISWWEALRVNGNQVYIWNTLVFRCSDDVSENPTKSFTFSWNPISPWYSFDKSGSISMKATDEAWNVSNAATSQINKKEVIDEIKCSLHKSEINISKWDKITRNGKEIFIWSEKIFAWDSDDYAFSINFDDNKNIQLPYTIENSGDITFTLTNKWKSGTWTTKVTIDEVDNNKSPEITRKYPEDKTPNILWWVTVNMKNNQLLFWNTVMYEWKDDNTETCTPSLNVKWNTEKIKTWETIKDWGTLSYTLTDEKWKSTSVEFSIESKGIDLTNLNSLSMQVGQETDLLKWISIPSGIQVSKVEVETNWQRQEIKGNNGHYLYTPTQPWTCYIYVTQKWEFWNTYVEKSKNPLTIKDIEHPEYQAVSINNIKPEEVFPQIAQIKAWDPNIYKYVEDLRVAETYVMRDMMWKYGTGKYSPEEYQQLLSRVTMGLIEEKPDNYQDYERIWPSFTPTIRDHGVYVFKNLINLQWKQTKVMNLSGKGEWRAKNLSEYAKAHPNDIFLFSNSTTPTAISQTNYKNEVFEQNIIDLCDLPNVIIFVAWGDTETDNWVSLKILYNGVYDEKFWEWRYLYSSMANSDKNNYPSSNMRIVVWNHPSGSVDVSNSSWSLFPYWFDNNVTISGHPVLPIYRNWRFRGEDYAARWWYYSSYVAPTVTSEVQQIFGLHADVNNADELLEMMESCTANPDYISLNWKKQALQKYSPANFAEKYCMIMDIPSSIKPWEIITLNKWRYKWLVLNIAWTEVKINWQLVEYNKANESLIKSQNPMNLEQRINWDLVAKYSKNWSVKWKLIAVDDQWNGLNMEKDITINVK